MVTRYIKASIGSVYRIAAIEVGATYPTPTDTGSSGTLSTYSGPQEVTNANFTSMRFTQPMKFYGTPNLRNCRFDSWVLIQLTVNGVVESCDATGWSLSSVQGLTMAKVEAKGSGSDLMHVTSDAGRQCKDIVIKDSCFHSPNPAPGAHADGIQVRGINGLKLIHNTFDMGPWRTVNGQDVLNAAVFLEQSNGGNSNILVDNNYLNGGGYIFRAGTGGHTNLDVINNKFGPDGRYGTHFLNQVTPRQWYGNKRHDGSTLPA